MRYISISLGIILIFCCNNFVNCARILCIFPSDAISHFNSVKNLLIELTKRGHEVVLVSAFPQKVPGLIDISCSDKLKQSLEEKDVSEHAMSFGKVGSEVYSIYKMIDIIENIFEIQDVKDLLNSKDAHFDLVISELFKTDVPLGFAYKFNNTPSILVSSSSLIPWGSSRFGYPDNPAYIPNIFTDFSNHMNFWQRIQNTYAVIVSKLLYNFLFVPKSDYLARKYFGEDLPSLEEIGLNSSLVLVNTHPSLHGVRPLGPNVIEVGGIHIQPAKQIPKDLEKFINESKHGVVYFCMGSMLKGSTLPDDKRQALIDVFSRLPQRVLWKWENETMPGKPDNVKLAKWMPQRDVLAHPNVRLFISHGGLLGTTEAVHSGVPILGMPFYGDQGVNIAAVVSNGAGLRLDFKDLNKDTLYTAVKELLENPKYRENAKDLSERFRDRPLSPLDTAIYWTEYVIRHKGAPHLRSAAVDLAWYQYLLLDVIAFMLLVVVATLTVFYYLVKCICNLWRKIFSKPVNTKTKKRKNE